MQKASAQKSGQRSENAILDQAIQQLLAATKEEGQRSGQPIDSEKLRQEGYSERFIGKVENA